MYKNLQLHLIWLEQL